MSSAVPMKNEKTKLLDAPIGDATAAAAVIYEPRRSSNKAIASLVCSLVGLFFFGIILGPIAIHLGLKAKKDIRERPNEVQGECMATSGIVIGSIEIALFIIGLIIVVSSMVSAEVAFQDYDFSSYLNDTSATGDDFDIDWLFNFTD